MDDEDKILLLRESAKYEEKISKKSVRELMFIMKVKGYNQIVQKDVLYLKVFLGYVMEISLLSDPVVMNALISCIRKDDFGCKLALIMKMRLINSEEIAKYLQ